MKTFFFRFQLVDIKNGGLGIPQEERVGILSEIAEWIFEQLFANGVGDRYSVIQAITKILEMIHVCKYEIPFIWHNRSNEFSGCNLNLPHLWKISDLDEKFSKLYKL
jgi:hypothetical protein